MSKPFHFLPENINLDFIGKSKFLSMVSVIVIGACFYGFFTKGFNFGVDFTGGEVVQVKFKTPSQAEEVRALVAKAGADSASVVALGTEKLEYLITVRSAETQAKSFKDHFIEIAGPTNVSIERSDVVGPKVGSELKASALRSLFYSIILIMIYIWLRFDARFAPGATVAMVHDLLIMCGFYIFTGKEFTIASIAALLTIAGYSVNDTIVIYDRVREMLTKGGQDLPLGPTINKAINLTLSRTIITSMATLLSVIALVVYCSGELQAFAEALVIGILVGTFSTYFIAAPISIVTQKLLAAKSK